MATILQLRRGTAAEWTAADPILLEGEIGLETDTKELKIGDGATAWTALGYFSAGMVTKALYDAQSVVTATSDNTPIVTAMAEGTLLGRAAGGNVAALTNAAVLTAMLSVTLAENDLIQLEELLSADGKVSGIGCNGVMGTNVAWGDLLYLNNDDGRWELADADQEATCSPQLGIALETGADGDTKKILLIGYIREDDWNWTTVGGPLFVHTTDGDMVETAPSGAGDIIRVVGYVKDANSIFFNPSGMWLEHA